MRGNYYPDTRATARVSTDSDAFKLPAVDDNRPTVVDTPNRPASRADAVAIVRAVAFRAFLAVVDDVSPAGLQADYPALAGISADDVRAILLEELA